MRADPAWAEGGEEGGPRGAWLRRCREGGAAAELAALLLSLEAKARGIDFAGATAPPTKKLSREPSAKATAATLTLTRTLAPALTLTLTLNPA